MQQVIVMIDERKRLVLRAIVQDYVSTAEPVGSRSVARRYDFGVSPATIRNEMADLEEMGYLAQPHTSAGRIPSNKGYRFYVDELMDVRPPSPRDLQSIRQLYAQQIHEVQQMLRHAARVLSEVTGCLVLIEGPSMANATFCSLQLVPMRAGRALMVLVTDDGLVDHRILEVPPHLQREDLERIASILSERMSGLRIGQVREHVLEQLQSELIGYRTLLSTALDPLLVADDDDYRYVMGGANNILKQPEFRDVERAAAILQLLGEQHLVRDLLAGLQPRSDDVTVYIGDENPVDIMHECSVVTAVYRVDGREMGRVAVVGPTRMNYPRVVSVVGLVAQGLSAALTRMLG